MKVQGQPATIDETGLHLGSSTAPVNDAANQIAQQALSQAGFQVVVTKPIVKASGTSAEVTAGSLVLLWSQQGNTVAFTFGATTAKTDAQLGVDSGAGPGAVDTGGGNPTEAGGASALPSLVGGPDSQALGTTGAAPVAPGATGPAGRQAVSVGNGDLVSADFGTGNPVWLVVLGLLAAVAVATRMRRLTDDAVAVPEEPCEGES